MADAASKLAELAKRIPEQGGRSGAATTISGRLLSVADDQVRIESGGQPVHVLAADVTEVREVGEAGEGAAPEVELTLRPGTMVRFVKPRPATSLAPSAEPFVLAQPSIASIPRAPLAPSAADIAWAQRLGLTAEGSDIKYTREIQSSSSALGPTSCSRSYVTGPTQDQPYGDTQDQTVSDDESTGPDESQAVDVPDGADV